jgi:S-phase kinase-associated protein 1
MAATSNPSNQSNQSNQSNLESLDDELDKQITIITSDNKQYIVSNNILKMSKFIQKVLSNDPQNHMILLDKIPGPVFERIISYCTHHLEPHKPIEKPLNNKISNLICPYDNQFLNSLSTKELIELAKLSNYLDISSLYELLCANFASMIRGKTSEEIRDIFGIFDDKEDDKEEDEEEEEEKQNAQKKAKLLKQPNSV